MVQVEVLFIDATTGETKAILHEVPVWALIRSVTELADRCPEAVIVPHLAYVGA